LNRLDSDKNIIPRDKREEKCGNIESKLSMLVSRDFIPILALVYYNRSRIREERGVYYMFGVLVVLGLALYDLYNTLYASIREGEKVNIDILG
jgi:hypothetical protein